MPVISTPTMVIMLCAFGVGVVSLTWFTRKRADNAEGFTVAGRTVGMGLGASCILSTWVYACSLYIPAQCGYKYGLAGPLYYSLGGALMVVMFAFLVARIRKIVPAGHTIAEYLGARFGRPVHILMTAKFILVMPEVLYLNLTVIGHCVTAFSPVSYEVAVLVVSAIFTGYAIISGLRASITTDFLQLGMISVLGIIIAPVVYHNSGGVAKLAAALPGLGEKASLFSPTAAVLLGIPWMIASVTGSLTNPSFWQRVWAIKPSVLKRAFLLAGAGWFPYSLAFGLFGVIALTSGISSQAGDGNDITGLVAARFLPAALAPLFVLAIIAAGSSSCDSALSAFSSIFMTDLHKRYLRPQSSSRELVLVGRLSMLLCTAAGIRLAMLNMPLIEFLFLLGAFGQSITFPIVASLWWRRMNAAGFIGGTIVGSVAGVATNLLTKPFSPLYATWGLLVSLGASALMCTVFALLNKERFDFDTLNERVKELA